MEKVTVEFLEKAEPENLRIASDNIRSVISLVKFRAPETQLALAEAYANCLEYIAKLKDKIHYDLVDNLGTGSGGGKANYEAKGRRQRG